MISGFNGGGRRLEKSVLIFNNDANVGVIIVDSLPTCLCNWIRDGQYRHECDDRRDDYEVVHLKQFKNRCCISAGLLYFSIGIKILVVLH